MKKIFIIATAAVFVFTACKSKQNSNLQTDKNMVLVDTTGLSKNSYLTDVGNTSEAVPAEQHKNVARSRANRPASNAPVANTSNNSNNGSGTTAGSGSNGNTNTVNSGTTVPADKRVSDAAKGAAIGAGSGAILGVLISKNNAKGAVIGGVIGAGAGYAIGRSRDKKSGRVARQKARRKARRAL